MIPAKPNTWLTYTDQYSRNARAIGAEVIAWDGDGWPMVMGEHGLNLVPPSNIKSIEVKEHAQFETFTHFTPVSDLFALHRAEDGLYEKQLIGWAVTGGGDIVPVAEEAQDGMIAVSRDDDYIIAFRAPDRERVYAEHGESK